MNRPTRRDFLKLASSATLAAIFQKLYGDFPVRVVGREIPDKPNVIVLVFDTMSARHLSLYGYGRETTPNLKRFAERSTVFHSCISGGNYTTPGTATIITGMYPWTHRAINQSGLMLRKLVERNVFALFSDYNRFAYTQNLWADYLLTQFESDLEIHLLPTTFSLVKKSAGEFFRSDRNAGYRSMDDFLFQTSERPASLLFGPLEKYIFLYNLARTSSKGYSRGLPHDVTNPKYFRLEDVYQGVYERLIGLSTPFFAYIHLYAPHEPYRPRIEFENIFDDGWRPEAKPKSRFSDGSTYNNLITRRTNYDEYVANVDAEFGTLINALSKQGILDTSIVVVTSDHGQLFERGVHGHTTPLLYEPVIHIPLLISLPGQSIRKDIFTPVSSADIVPTLLTLIGREVPSWCDGEILSGYTMDIGNERSKPVFTIEAKSNSAFAPLHRATISMRKGASKLIYYTGYGFDDWFELYNIESDPEELQNLYADNAASRILREELLWYLEASNKMLE
jgi:arylsulfatase A-like enzyme